MTALSIFKSSFISHLKLGLPLNIQKYSKEEAWAEKLSAKTNGSMLTPIEPRADLELICPTDGDLKDLQNAIRIHGSLMHISPLQARDPRLWVRLAHVEHWNYMRARWDVAKHLNDSPKACRFVDSRYFISQSQSRALLRHGIARLWWISRISYDSQLPNPYELTGVLLSTLDITQQILERGIGRAPELVKGFLEFLMKNKDPLLNGGEANRSKIRHLAKFLNLLGGVCILDCLTRSEVVRSLDREYTRISAESENS